MHNGSTSLVNYSEYKPRHYLRILWWIVNRSIFRLLVGRRVRVLRNPLLRLFGAKIPSRAQVYSTCNIYAPWNLEVGSYVTIGPHVEVYNKDRIVIGDNVVISQGAFLCTASHDISKSLMPLVTRPIVLKRRVWVASGAFIGPGVTIGEGAVVGACSAVFKDVEAWTVVGGNPARFIKKRMIEDSDGIN